MAQLQLFLLEGGPPEQSVRGPRFRRRWKGLARCVRSCLGSHEWALAEQPPVAYISGRIKEKQFWGGPWFHLPPPPTDHFAHPCPNWGLCVTVAYGHSPFLSCKGTAWRVLSRLTYWTELFLDVSLHSVLTVRLPTVRGTVNSFN
jgi:hypothetical protein